MKYLAVDLGASSGRTILADLGDKQLALRETHRFNNSMLNLDGSRFWDLDALVDNVKIGITKAGQLDGIGIDTWGVDYGLIDDEGTVIGRPYAYRDPRTEPAVPEVHSRVPRERLYQITGIQEMTLNTIFQLTADRMERPHVLQIASRMLFIPELLAHILTGQQVCEYSIASTSGLLDVQTRTWSQELLEALELPSHLFGEVQPPGVVVGQYEGLSVCLPAAHDTGSAVAAVPAVDDGDWAYISSGTWSLVGIEADRPIVSDAARQANFTNEGGVNGTIRFLKNVTGLWLVQECQRLWSERGQHHTFDALAAAAAASQFSSTINPNDARFMAPEDMLEELAAACADSGQPVPRDTGEYMRCCYLSLAQAYRDELRQLAAVTGRNFKRIHIVGGGAKADLLNQLTADYCQLPVYAGPAEATALGNICVQALAGGQITDLTALRQLINRAYPPRIFRPQG